MPKSKSNKKGHGTPLPASETDVYGRSEEGYSPQSQRDVYGRSEEGYSPQSPRSTTSWAHDTTQGVRFKRAEQ